jgi:hypothetical protein
MYMYRLQINWEIKTKQKNEPAVHGAALLERGLDIDRGHCYHESSGWFCKHRTTYGGEYQRGKPLLSPPQPLPEVPETALAA